MKERHFTKTIALLLATLMLVFAMPFTSFAVTPDNEGVTEVENSIPEAVISEPTAEVMPTATDPFAVGPGEKSLAELQSMTVDLATLPEVIEDSVALEKGHVNRLTAQEKNTNTIIYQNTNGTKSTYIFGSPVKYIDDNGNVKDKSSAVSAVLDINYSHAMLNNSTRVYFPKTSGGNVVVWYENDCITMTPVSEVAATSVYNSENNSVMYLNVFGQNTALMYTTSLYGVKEDIILIKNIGENEFEFELTANGLTPAKIEGVWYLVDSSNEKIASLGKVIIKDSNGIATEGTMNVTAAPNGKYTVTITAPESFLNDDGTEYPVYIDPTVTIYEEGYCTGTDEYGDPYYVDYDAIVDIGLYNSEYGLSDAYDMTYRHWLGYAAGGEGRVIYRLYDFYGEYGQFTELHESQIGSVTLHVKTVASYDNTTIRAMPLSTDEYPDNTLAVCDSTLWNAHVDICTSCTCTETVCDSTSCVAHVNPCAFCARTQITAGTTEIVMDITEIARGWARYNNGMSTNTYDMARNGFVLMSKTYAETQLYSTEAEGTNNVYVVMDTSNLGGLHYINNLQNEQYLSKEIMNNGVYAGNKPTLSDSDHNAQWYLEYIGNNNYYIRSMADLDYYLCTHSGETLVRVGEYSDNSTINYIWQITYSHLGGYTIKDISNEDLLNFGFYNPDHPEYVDPATLYDLDEITTLQLWRFITVCDFVPLTDFTVDDISWLDTDDAAKINYTVTPSNATFAHDRCFEWSSSDTDVATITDDGVINTHQNGTTTITVKHIFSGAKYDFILSVGQIIPNGTYYIMNRETTQYLGLDGDGYYDDEGMAVNQTALKHKDSLEGQWVLSYESNGYYRIMNYYSYGYVTYNTSANANYPEVYQKFNTDNSNLWRILPTINGGYMFVSAYFNNFLCLKNGDIEDCIVAQYSQDANYDDEWLFSNVNNRLTINIYNDRPFDVRCTDEEVSSKITEIMNTVREFYAYKFFVCIDFSEVTEFDSSADRCQMEYDEDCFTEDSAGCSCLIEGQVHHKDLSCMIDSLPDPGDGISTYLLFTGHETCSASEHSSNGGVETRGMSDCNSRAVVRYNTNAKIMVIVTIHEIGHWFDAPDHYNEGQTDELNEEKQNHFFDDYCIYGKEKGSYEEYGSIVDIEICDGCMERMMSQLNRFPH